MSADHAHKQLFELWHQSSLSALNVSKARLGLADAVKPEIEDRLLKCAMHSWEHPEPQHD